MLSLKKDKPRFLIIDGPDGAGKTTLVKDLANNFYRSTQKVDFKKTGGGVFKMITENDFQIAEAFIELLPPKVYIFDRWYLSNLAYEPESINPSELVATRNFRYRLKRRYDVFEVVLLRDPVTEDFADDKIFLKKDQFNKVIDNYTNFDDVDVKMKIINNAGAKTEVYNRITDFIYDEEK